MGIEVLIAIFASFSITLCQNEVSLGGLKVLSNVNISTYLSTYGYTPYYTETKTSLEKGIAKLQEFANLKVTGKIDAATLKLMQTDRCGVRDPIDPRELSRKRRYSYQGTKWINNKVTWFYGKHYSSNQYRVYSLRKAAVKNVLKNAMHLWQRRANIEFVEETGKKEADIRIAFTRRVHGDPFPFDGRGGSLAHAFFPLTNIGLAGDVHFDDAERFTIGDSSGKGRDLMWVATHELGHSLGLDHSSVEDSVMYPWYTGYRKDFDLQYDDILGIQRIYGGKSWPVTTPTTTTAPTTTTTNVPKTKKCPTSKVTGIWFQKKGNLYVISTANNKLYKVHLNGSIADGPLDTKDEFPRIKDAITGSFELLRDGKEYKVIFTNNKYYIYEDSKYISGPHGVNRKSSMNSDRSKVGKADKSLLNLNFSSWVRIDAVFRWRRNKRIYIFTKDWYWRYNEEEGKMDEQYPRRIQNVWRGLPKTVDSAHSSPYTPHTLFTAGNMIYEFNDRLVKTKKGFPKDVLQYWLKCDRS